MRKRLRVGIIGLGRRWSHRYAPALAALSELFQITAVYDPIPQRASVEAARLQCVAAGGAAALIERDDVEAILLLDLGWQRLWPIERAARAGKPVFCLPDLADDAPHAPALVRTVEEAGLAVMMAVPAAYQPAALQLAERREPVPRAIRLVVCQAPLPESEPAPFGLLTWLFSLVGAAPAAVTASGDPAAGLYALTVELAGGGGLHLARWRRPDRCRSLRLDLIGESHRVTVLGPRRLSWTAPDGLHSLTLPRSARLEQVMLTRFHAMATRRATPRPGLGEAHRAWLCWQAAERSQREGRRVVL